MRLLVAWACCFAHLKTTRFFTKNEVAKVLMFFNKKLIISSLLNKQLPL